jgi:hypothetical protein
MADTTGDLYKALGELVYAIITRDTIEVQMSALTDAVAAMKARIDEDVAHLRALVDQAIAANAGDDAEIARLTAEADEAVANISAIDPVAEFPPVEPPA